MIKIAGVDPSMSSSGLCIMTLDDNYDVIDMELYGYNMVRKWCIDTDKVHIKCVGTSYSSMNIYDRINIVTDYHKSLIDGVSHVAFEDFSYDSKKGLLYQIGEFVGALRKNFYDQGIPIDRYAPTSIKLFATGNGQASKYMMLLAYQQKFPSLFYKEIFDDLALCKTPQEDIVDAFWICEILRCKLKHIAGLETDIDVINLLKSKSTAKTTSILETKTEEIS